VLGDENATNSIGKSTLLMIIDFALGGTSFLVHNRDVITEIGHHDYYISFVFDGTAYYFRRGTYEDSIIYVCDEDRTSTGALLSIDEYTAWLKASYGLGRDDPSFRSMAGLYFRVWGKENLDVHKPLHAAKAQSSKECIDNLIKTFGRYSEIRDLASDLKAREAVRSALKAAFSAQLIPKIGKREHNENVIKIERIEQEIDDIKENLARYATNISELANRDVLELKVSKDELLAMKFKLESKLARTQRNLSGNRFVKSRHFDGLLKYFPTIDAERLADVETFHSELAALLRAELLQAEESTVQELARVASELASIDERMVSTLRRIDQPSIIVDRVYELSNSLKKAKEENQRFESAAEIKTEIANLKESFSAAKVSALSIVEGIINDGVRRIVATVFGQERKSPQLHLKENSYTYQVFEDTGTGTAYAALIVFDLTIFESTRLPAIAHDSLLFKNVENDSVSQLLEIYSRTQKQSFIAIDEIEKYGEETARMLRERKIIQLTNANVLFDKDWRS
jgi:hypothetical protein